MTGKIREEINKQSREPVNTVLWYLIGLPLMLALSSLFTWDSIDIPEEALPMVAGCGLAYVITWFNLYRSSSYLSYRTIGLSALVLTISFILVVAVMASFRLYYSRFFLLSSYLISLTWFVFGMLIFQESVQRFMIILGGISNKLREFPLSSEWSFVTSLPAGNNLRQFDALVIDMHEHDDPKLLRQLADASLHGVPVRHAASVFEEYSGRTSLAYLAHEGIFDLVRDKIYVPVKRVWESACIILSSVVILPLAAITALCIRFESGGPVLFTQKRMGKDGELFTLYKFRSMETNSEENGARFAGEEDHRITTVGRFIRKYRIDEIPQFWNVLKGEMSLIGPRPEQPQFVEQFDEEIPFYFYRHKVRPGITGWAQNKKGYVDDLESTRRKLEYDLYYVKNLSLSLDILIVYATIKTILTGFGSR